MAFSLADIIMGICFLTTAILGTIVLIKSRAFASKFLALTSYGVSFWILVSFLFYNLEGGPVIIFAKLQYVAGIFLASNFVLFAYFFLETPSRKNNNLIFVTSAIFVVFTALMLATPLFIEGVEMLNGSKSMLYGPFYYSYTLYFFILVGASYYYLISKFKRTENRLAKVQLIYIGTGAVVTTVISVAVDIFFPFFGNFTWLWIGPVSSTFFIICTSYAILRHNLFDIKLVSTELLVFAILITVFIQILTAVGFIEILARAGFFIVVALLSFWLLKSIHKEISQRQEIERLAQRLSDFVSFTTHELRAPVSKFKFALSMLLDGSYGELPPKAKENVQRSFDTAIEMGQSIETFLSLNKLEIDKLELSKQRTDIQEVVSKCVNDFKEKIKSKNISLIFKKSKNIPEVSVDKFLICHAINNFIDNAIKYTPKGGSVKIYLNKKDKEVVFNVEDTGIGIDPYDLPVLFEQYERGGQKEAKMFSEGSGLGLFLSKKLVELHGGKIWAESEGRGRGSRFSFSLPLKA